MSAPNLDAMEDDDCLTFWHKVYCNPVRTARELFEDSPPKYVRATRNLGAYAANIGTAKACRKRGDVQAALIYERIADDIYQDLPAYARW